MKSKTASMILALWVVLAGALGAFASVCSSPCCMPSLSVSGGHSANHEDSQGCGMEGMASESEAALFFAEENGLAGNFLSASGHHIGQLPGCTAELKVNQTQTALLAKHISVDPPKAVPVEMGYVNSSHLMAVSHPTFLILHIPGGPPGHDLQTSLSRFIC